VRLFRITGLLVGAVVLASCTALPDSEPDIEAAEEFDGYPLYWVGERFERWDLVHVDLSRPAQFTTFIYGECTPTGEDEPSCEPPLQIQVYPLCAHLATVARAPIWKRRSVRGAPVGSFDSAPVLFASGAQVKVYRGEGSDPSLPMRALRELRSVNRVEPVIGPTDPIPAAPQEVLEGSRPC
jgi:hypothetical protein